MIKIINTPCILNKLNLPMPEMPRHMSLIKNSLKIARDAGTINGQGGGGLIISEGTLPINYCDI
jgi:hypothetical protein